MIIENKIFGILMSAVWPCPNLVSSSLRFSDSLFVTFLTSSMPPAVLHSLRSFLPVLVSLVSLSFLGPSVTHSVPYGPSLRRGWRRGRHEGSESQTKWWSDDTKDRPLLPSACRPSSRSLFSSHSLQSSSLYLRVSVHLRLTSFPTAMMIGVIETAKRSVA